MSENRNFDSVYAIKLAQIAALEGDTTKKYDSVYEEELEMLRLLEQGGGGGGAVIDDNNVSTGTVWSSSKTLEKITELGLKIEIVDELPETGEAKTIYLVPSEVEEEGNVYDEYLYINNAWERMGSTKIDLTNYYTKTQTDALLDEKVDSADVYTKTDIDTKFGGVDSSLNLKANSADVYTKTQTDDLLDEKANVEDVYTKTNIDAKFGGVDSSLNLKANSADVYTKTQTDNLLDEKANVDDVYTKTTIDTKFGGVDTSLNLKANSADVYTKTTIDSKFSGVDSSLNLKANSDDVYTKTDIDTKFGGVDSSLNLKANSADVYTKTQTDDLLDEKANVDDIYTKTTIDSKFGGVDSSLNLKANSADVYTKTQTDDLLDDKQDTLVSGTNIKTINSLNILGSGNVEIQGGPEIDDQHVSTSKVWSSNKVNNMLNTKPNVEDIYVRNVLDEKFADISTELEEKADTDDVYTKTDIDTKFGGVDSSLNLKANSADVYTKTQTDDLLDEKVDVDDIYTKTTIDTKFGGVDSSLNLKADSADVYTKTQTDDLLDEKVDSADVYTKTTIDTKFGGVDSSLNLKANTDDVYTKTQTDDLLDEKQDTLVSGTNIKTINNLSLLGAGNINIQGGSGGSGVVSLTQAEYDALVDKDPNTIYNITDATPYVMEDYALLTDLQELEESLPTTYNPYNTATASTSGFKFPAWNARGQITGSLNQCYQRTFSINGNSNTLYSTTTATMRNVWAAENNGNEGQVLQARGGNLSPQWVDFKSDATAYIKESDCSTGTYSDEIEAFYADCMAAGKIGPMQLVNDTIHNVHVLNKLTTHLNDQDFAVKQGETATLKYGAHTIVIEEDGTITDTDATGVVTAVTSYQILEYNVYNYSETATDLDVIDGNVFNLKTEQHTSHSYYLPSSTRLYESFVELWFFTTEDGQTWNNLHIKIDATTVTADATSGTFGA